MRVFFKYLYSSLSTGSVYFHHLWSRTYPDPSRNFLLNLPRWLGVPSRADPTARWFHSAWKAFFFKAAAGEVGRQRREPAMREIIFVILCLFFFSHHLQMRRCFVRLQTMRSNHSPLSRTSRVQGGRTMQAKTGWSQCHHWPSFLLVTGTEMSAVIISLTVSRYCRRNYFCRITLKNKCT